jgi:hypothetical protein
MVAFHVSKVLGYVPATARFTMHPRRFYTAQALERDVTAAGLRIRSRRELPLLPGRALVVAAWVLRPGFARGAKPRATAGRRDE